MSIKSTLAREARVALSKKAQPVWFRVSKWVVIILVVARFWRTPGFWWWVLAVFVCALLLHLFWRYKTRNWTQPWGGWNDLESGRKP